jgi:hypothetical protein
MLSLGLLHDLVKSLNLFLRSQQSFEDRFALGLGADERNNLIYHIGLHVFLCILKTRNLLSYLLFRFIVLDLKDRGFSRRGTLLLYFDRHTFELLSLILRKSRKERERPCGIIYQGVRQGRRTVVHEV